MSGATSDLIRPITTVRQSEREGLALEEPNAGRPPVDDERLEVLVAEEDGIDQAVIVAV